MLLEALSPTNYHSVISVTIFQSNHGPIWDDELVGLKVYSPSRKCICIGNSHFIAAAVATSLVTQQSGYSDPKFYCRRTTEEDDNVLEQSRFLKQHLACGIVQHDVVPVEDFIIALDRALGTVDSRQSLGQ